MVTAFMSPCLNQMANLSFFWESRYGHLVFTQEKKDRLILVILFIKRTGLQFTRTITFLLTAAPLIKSDSGPA